MKKPAISPVVNRLVESKAWESVPNDRHIISCGGLSLSGVAQAFACVEAAQKFVGSVVVSKKLKKVIDEWNVYNSDGTLYCANMTAHDGMPDDVVLICSQDGKTNAKVIVQK